MTMKKKNLIKEGNKAQNAKNRNRKKKDHSTNCTDTLINLSEDERASISENIRSSSSSEESHSSAIKILRKNGPQRGNIKVSSKIHYDTASEGLNFHCPYCNLNFTHKSDLQEHCLTDEHQSVILSDEGRDWKFRPPPRGILSIEYTLCQSFFDKRICRFGNQCIQAHSEKELSEWKERFDYRTMKLDKAKEKELHGATYADKFLEKLQNSQNLEQLVSEKLDKVVCSASSDVSMSISQKPSSHTWTLTLHCPYQICTVALLHDSHRNHFSLTNITMINCQKHIHKSFKLGNTQEWTNPDFTGKYIDEPFIMEFKIDVYFTTEIYGTFRQALVVDFGFEPVFMKKFCVDIVPLEDYKELESARTTVITQCERWCEENTEIILFSPQEKFRDDLLNDKFLELYPPPTNKNISLNQSSLEKHPTRYNYITRMHDLLSYEEMAQFDLLSHFNIKSYLQLTKSYLLMPYPASELKFAMAGELYAKLDLSSEISEDTPHGRLILNNCNSVLISSEDENILVTNRTTNRRERRAYESLIEGKTKKEIYLRLSKEAVANLKLVPDIEVPLDIQFQLNRLPLCEMHVALDRISCFDQLFPDVISEPVIPWSPTIQWSDLSDLKLNLKQKEALVAITTSLDIKLPPVLIIGPFGTGKTFTLGQAIKQLIQQPNTYILVCTHSNSAADIYIRDYLHPLYDSGVLEAKPLRIYYHKRRTGTVQSIVQKYCLIETRNGEQKFILPTKEQILEHRIIVTTINTSICLAQLGIEKGHFTHILIDEAAQVMECATLIPLSLADALTRVVLAGDYMQLCTEVFSSVCREKNLQNSLLERLYDLYPSDYPCRIMLVENYRSHPAIIKYTSNFFYEGRLMPRAKISAHPLYHPLTFFTAMGEDVQDATSTAFYNNSEVMEICERVSEILKSWPEKLWGPVKEDSIGVLSPYLDQVVRIRSALRKKKLYKVSVERVLNVQGKEFRAVVLSTVRTRHTCTGNDSTLDFGFLSNAKLLTTAITRAQSLVAVVGDPVSLCSLGKCRKLWEEFIRQCSDAGSLYGISWSSLRSQLDGIEYRKIYGLNPLAQEFIPRYLILPAVPPVALIPQVPAYPYIPLARPLAYSAPNIFPAVPLQYHNSGFVHPQLPVVPPVQKPFDVSKTVPLNHPVYSAIGNVFQNRANLPYGNSTAISHMPAVQPQGYYHPSQTLPPGYVPGPSLGVFMAGGYPGQAKFGLYPPYIPARPSLAAQQPKQQLLNPLDAERMKTGPTLISYANSSQNNQRPARETRSSSPEKNIQFFNNVHFPKGSNESAPMWNDAGPLNNAVKDIYSPSIQQSVKSTSDSMKGKASNNTSSDAMIDRFAEEISRLLNDQSPTKVTTGSNTVNDSYRNNNVRDGPLMRSSFITQSSSNIDVNPAAIFGSAAAISAGRNSFLRSMPTLQQVEESFRLQAQANKSNSFTSNTRDSGAYSVNQTVSDSLNTQNSQKFSQSLSNKFSTQSPSQLLGDASKWSSRVGDMSTQSQLSLNTLSPSFLGSSLLQPSAIPTKYFTDMNPTARSSSTSNIPLYLRKGSQNITTKQESSAGNDLGASKGWDFKTIHNAGSENVNSIQSVDRFLSPRTQKSNFEEELNNLFMPKNPSAQTLDSSCKTYAGVLRSKLDHSDGF